jgi:hypothetical protein
MTDTSVELSVLLAEYGALKDEQAKRIDRRDHLVWATWTAIAATLVAAAKIPEALLLLPAAAVIVGWTHLANDHMVSAIGRYLRDDLGERLTKLSGEPVLGWEHDHPGDTRRRQRKSIQLAVDTATFAGPALVSLGAYLALTDPPVLGWLAALVLAAAATCLVAQQVAYAGVGREGRTR